MRVQSKLLLKLVNKAVSSAIKKKTGYDVAVRISSFEVYKDDKDDKGAHLKFEGGADMSEESYNSLVNSLLLKI